MSQTASIKWEPDFDETLKAAKAGGNPIMIAFIMDGELANDEVVKTHFQDKDIVELSSRFHCLVASVGVHAATSAEGVCPRFGAHTCASHQRISMRAQADILQSIRVSAPQFIFLSPDGQTVLLRHVWILPPAELARKMRLALAFAGTSPSEVEKQQREEVTRILERAGDKNPSVRSPALQQLAEVDDPRIIDFLIKQTGENVEDARRAEAIDAMGRRGNAKALPVLVKLLKSIIPKVRNRSVLALERLAMIEAGDPLRAALKSEVNDHVRSNMIRALAVSDADTPETVKIIVTKIESGTPKERVAAIRAACDIPMSDPLKKALLAAAQHPTIPIVRGAAWCVLADHQVKEAAPIIEKALPREPLPDMKSMGQSALSILKGTAYDGASGADVLRKFLPDEHLR